MSTLFAKAEATRHEMYAAATLIVAAVTGFGIWTETQGVAITGLIIAVITLALAAVNAFQQRDRSITRGIVYAVISAGAAVAVAFELISQEQINMILPAVLAVLGLFLAEGNTESAPQLARRSAGPIEP